MTEPRDPMAGAAPDGPHDALRDARLVRALQHMPDAHMQPSAHLRQAVLQEALRAVAGGVPRPQAVPARSGWWQRWREGWRGSGQHVPWSAALASVAMVGFITVLWYGREVPDADPDRTVVAQRKADAVPAAAESRAGGTPAAPSAPATPPVIDSQTGATTRLETVPAQRAAAAKTAVPTGAHTTAVAGNGPVVREEAARMRANESVAAASVQSAPAPELPPAPAVAQGAVAPAPALADAAAQQRSRADARAAASAPAARTVLVNGSARGADTEPVRTGLALLRGLPYAPSTRSAAREDIPAQADEDLGGGLSAAPLVVEIAGVERWTVTAQQVRYQRLDSGHSTQAAITPAQYQALQRMARAQPQPPR